MENTQWDGRFSVLSDQPIHFQTDSIVRPKRYLFRSPRYFRIMSVHFFLAITKKALFLL
ncbi:hypothetical protein BX661DRAFT_182891, partial [Kickxella alabastrina]|uniref:uncharacterized protein n=1 Tax=Kickxella alabastrina TaxID=61397 RepID=UPI0022208F17